MKTKLQLLSVFCFLILSIGLFGQTAYEYNERGIAKERLGQYQAAIKDYNKAIRIDPNYKYAYNTVNTNHVPNMCMFFMKQFVYSNTPISQPGPLTPQGSPSGPSALS